MTREIIFRGKRVDNGEWVEGYYFKAELHWHRFGVHEDWIATRALQNGGWCNVISRHAVIPETVGQYVGIKDKNGKKVYVGDIIKASHNFYPYTVFVRECKVCIEDKYGNAIRPTTEALKHFDSEVIGNIFDKESEK